MERIRLFLQEWNLGDYFEETCHVVTTDGFLITGPHCTEVFCRKGEC